MARKFTRRLVVDASAAFRAGEKTPQARRVREFLRAARRICHRVVVSTRILAEWKRHASPFAKAWLALMRSLGKEVTIPEGSDEAASLPSAVGALSIPAKGREAMAKDLPLVEAALKTDGLVVSCDDQARALFEAAASEVKEFRGIVWVNPGSESEDALGWLRAGARSGPEHRLWRHDKGQR